ncbi:DUF2158 domain-containing protein [Mesobacterium sp. TK19101]|uniref:DUF2158 domain-containing protein n=1 Tax=Mesobacterium hydrothermale TaxID=3111907 RepID=A0ABU6HFG6_9RHOB|nr:DUF2158 domain-containing protein [Mesobacterium sp. TK19101]MEC3860439.1 DUF2158 domain-containing protein [Mesobacterium sp. TK19101]
MASKFSPGDIVQLKSGGPAMTVSKVNDSMGSQTYTCEWFKGASNERAVFQEDTLKEYVAPSTS